MSNRKTSLVHFLALLVLSVSYFMGPSHAAPPFLRPDASPSTSIAPIPLDAEDSYQKARDATPLQGSPDDGPTTTTTTFTTTSSGSSSVIPTPMTTVIPAVEIVPPVTIIRQLGITAVVVASQGTTSTIQITASGAPGVPTGSNQVKPETSVGVGLTISSPMIAIGLAIAVWVVF